MDEEDLKNLESWLSYEVEQNLDRYMGKVLDLIIDYREITKDRDEWEKMYNKLKDNIPERCTGCDEKGC